MKRVKTEACVSIPFAQQVAEYICSSIRPLQQCSVCSKFGCQLDHQYYDSLTDKKLREHEACRARFRRWELLQHYQIDNPDLTVYELVDRDYDTGLTVKGVFTSEQEAKNEKQRREKWGWYFIRPKILSDVRDSSMEEFCG
jgi:hypothetical protein